ncbi:MAG: DUF5615 family PIN-like protein [Ignavibacteriae bacterium]|nr:DUF5615 family PIN-like protein [Ignavibacteriota bacterium]
MNDLVKLYTDEHIARAVIAALRYRGLDVLTTPEALMRGAADEEHLHLATRLGRVLITQDEDFLRIHAQGSSHCGIVFASKSLSISQIVNGISLLCEVLDSSEMENQIQFL